MPRIITPNSIALYAEKLNNWFEKMAREKLIATAEEDIDDYKAYLKKKLL